MSLMNWSEVDRNALICTDFGDWWMCKMPIKCPLKAEEEIILSCIANRYSKKINSALFLVTSSERLWLPLKPLCY